MEEKEKTFVLDYDPAPSVPEEKPLLKVVAEALDESGRLPEGFSLPEKNAEEGSISWADGAQDGVLMYHTERRPMSPEEQSLMADAVWAVSTGENEKADELFLQLSGLCPVLFYAEELQDYLLQNRETVSNETVYRYARRCIEKSPDKDLVKLGLTVLQLFETKNEQKLCAEIRTLAVCSEFTLYALQSILDWPDANAELFALAKKTYGWGRVQTMRFLKAENDAVKRWVLKEGVNNGVLPCYTARTAWELSDADKMLDGPLSAEEFGYIRNIIDALLDDEAVYGITRIKDPEIAIRRFLHRAQNFRLGPDDYRIIDQIQNRWEKDPLIPAMCRELKEHM
ncbi:MAG: hypothetical protein II725_02745 [Firmicutes bacterium]|nr:hypothetical protein [Bacillota bacterium]